MKHLFTILLFISSATLLKAQEQNSTTYIVVKIKQDFDYKKKTNYVFLEVEKGNDFAKDLYALQPYSNKKPSNDAVYSEPVSDSKSIPENNLNYFANVTTALNFLSKNGWKLDQVFPNITTEPEFTTVATVGTSYSKVVSEPIYIFCKTVKQ